MPSAQETPTPDAELRHGKPRRRELFTLGAILLAALLLRLPYLGRTSLWLDEMWSIATARMPWRSILSVVLYQDSNSSLYYALLHPWLRLGTGEASVRLLSVLLGTATPFAGYVLGKHLVSARVGLIACLLLAVNGFHIQYSQDARAYSLAVLLVTISTLLFVRAVEEPSSRNWCGYVLVSVLAVHAHIFSALVVASQGASLLLLPRRDIPWRRFLASLATMGVLVLPVTILVWIRAHEPMAPLAWVSRPTVEMVMGVFSRLSGNTDLPPRLLRAALLGSYAALFLVALLVAVKAFRTFQRSPGTWRLGLSFFWLIVPIAATTAISFLKPILVFKYLIVCLPALSLLAAIGIASIGRRWARTAVIAGVVVLALLRLPSYYQHRARNLEWPAATAMILARAQPGDAAIFFVAPGRLLFDYYRRALGVSETDIQVVYPEFRDEYENPQALAYLPPVRADWLGHVISRSRRVWLVLYHDEWDFTKLHSRAFQEGLAAKYQKSEEYQFDGERERVRLLLFTSEGSRP